MALSNEYYHSFKLYTAVRYVENNPVRAGLVNHAEYYPWSSASAHVNGAPANFFNLMDCPLVRNITEWREFLSEQEDKTYLDNLRNNTISGYPSGDNEFVTHIENFMGRSFKVRPRGRPKKVVLN